MQCVFFVVFFSFFLSFWFIHFYSGFFLYAIILQITRRYAEYSAAILGISENFPNDLVTRLLAELQEEVELFILRMAAIFQQRKEQLIFLINNYDMVLSVLTVCSHFKCTCQ